MAKVLHASSSGYFPACIQTAPTNKSNLVGGALNHIMELYWKVKTWRLNNVSGSLTFSGGNGEETVTYSASQQTLGSVSATTETDLVCNLVFQANAIYTLTSGSSSIAHQLYISLGGSYYINETTTYYTHFSFDMSFVTTTETQYPVGSVAINGLFVPLYGYIDGPPQTITGNISASISPTEYWPYSA